jgi:hypothetical protein
MLADARETAAMLDVRTRTQASALALRLGIAAQDR